MIEPLDYEAVGFMSGLEVHQQLLTAHKLFCRCPGGLYTHQAEALEAVRRTERPLPTSLRNDGSPSFRAIQADVLKGMISRQDIIRCLKIE